MRAFLLGSGNHFRLLAGIRELDHAGPDAHQLRRVVQRAFAFSLPVFSPMPPNPAGSLAIRMSRQALPLGGSDFALPVSAFFSIEKLTADSKSRD